MSGALMKVNPETGEITALSDYDPKQYLAALDVGHQQALAAAYDAACRALIGPNDVQKEGGREFKKKSAWRKLARHFNISTAVVGTHREYLGEVFVGTVTVRAVGPWGQSAEAVGVCSTDEATGQRVITIADAMATAQTRATNRATSDLIAMGEVSADELSPKRTASAPSSASTGGAKMPFGKTKGTLLADLPTKELESALEWAVSKDKFTEFQAEARAEIARRSAPQPLHEVPAALVEEGDDDLPF